MTSDPWQAMLLAIEPAYNMYKIAIETGPGYVPVSTYIDNKQVWELKIVEQWPDSIEYGTTESGKELAVRCKWCAMQLEKWTEVSFQSILVPSATIASGCWHQRWYFKNQQEIEKFITLYYLKW